MAIPAPAISVPLIDIPPVGPAVSDARSPPAFEPYIAASTAMRELTVLPVIVGAVLGMIFGASSLYLVLKVGMTVSASIPVAVISITLFRLFSKVGGRDATILENNIVQTAGSAGESIAFGLGVTMPAIMILGFDLEISRVMLVAVLGGLLGILMMIPLRRALIVQQHGVLKYPEGTACAEVLKAGASVESQAAASPAARREQAALGGSAISAATIFTGFGVGLAYKALNVAFKGWKDVPEKIFGPPFTAGSVAAEISPELLGVGYIIGPRIASVMCAGGVLAYLVLIPVIKFFGQGWPSRSRRAPCRSARCRPMTSGGLRPLYRRGRSGGRRHRQPASIAADDLGQPRGGSEGYSRRRPRRGIASPHGSGSVDESRRVREHRARGGDHARSAAAHEPGGREPHRGARLSVRHRVLAAHRRDRLLVESDLRHDGGDAAVHLPRLPRARVDGAAYYVTALSVGAIVCIASSNGGTTSQDLKTGFLVGATPRHQQIAIVIGALLSAVLLGPVLLQLNQAATVYVPRISREPLDGVLGAALRDVENFPATLRVDPATLSATTTYAGQQYLVWHKQTLDDGPAGQYLVDASGAPVYLVDPGINGTHRWAPDGLSQVGKFDAPKATLMSYIIKGSSTASFPGGSCCSAS